MPEEQVPRLYPQDYVMNMTILPFIPEFIKPNHITVARLLITPVILWCIFQENYTWGLPLFVLAALSDVVDGALARTRNLITPWGIFFDPIADKLLVGSTILIVGLQYYHAWLVFFVLFLDILPSLRWSSQKYSGGMMMANRWGKTKMVLQCISIGLLLLGIILQSPGYISLGEGAFALSAVFSLIAIITYSL